MLFLFLPVLAVLSSCTPMPSFPDGMMAAAKKDIRENSCNYDGAYEWGSNAARRNEAMDGKGLASYCPPAARAQVMNGYREGYASVGSGSRERVIVVHKDYPERNCIKAFGDKACGYDCKTGGGKVACAQDPSHRCLVSFGEIICGLNCREEYGSVECDERE